MFCETVGNPAGNIIDLAAVAEVAHARGVPIIADNTVATPLLLKPFQHGADVVIHSLTKFVGGHGTTLGGIVIDAGTFPWGDHPDRFGLMVEPEPAFHGVRYATDFPGGPVRHSLPDGRSAQYRRGAVSLQRLPALARTRDPGRAPAAPRVQHAGRGGVSSVGSPRDVSQLRRLPRQPLPRARPAVPRRPGPVDHDVQRRGGREAGIAVFNNVKLFKRLLNMGDAKSLITHPASTTHRQLTPDDSEAGGHHT